MVKVNNFDEFMDRVVGTEEKMSKEIDVSASRQQGVSGSFVIMFRGKLVESTANRLKKVIIRHGSNNDNSKEVYLGFPVEGTQKPRFVLLGKVDFNLQFTKEIQSVFTQIQNQVSYHLYQNSLLSDFNPDDLISTIKFKEPNRQEIFI